MDISRRTVSRKFHTKNQNSIKMSEITQINVVTSKLSIIEKRIVARM